MKLRTRFSLVFSLLALLVGTAGGFGLWYVHKIAQTTANFADITVPFLEETSPLVTALQGMEITLLTMLERHDMAEQQTATEALNTFDTAFHQGIEKLTLLAARGNLAVPLEETVAAQYAFVTQAHNMITAHQTKGVQSALAARRLLEFEQQRAQLDALLADFAQESEAAIAEREDRGKTLTQSGTATVGDLDALLSATLTESYPLVQGAYKLMRYLIQMQDGARSYLAASEPAQLTAIEENFQKSAKTSTSLLKRLTSRARTEQNKQTLTKIVQALAQLQSMVHR